MLIMKGVILNPVKVTCFMAGTTGIFGEEMLLSDAEILYGCTDNEKPKGSLIGPQKFKHRGTQHLLSWIYIQENLKLISTQRFLHNVRSSIIPNSPKVQKQSVHKMLNEEAKCNT